MQKKDSLPAFNAKGNSYDILSQSVFHAGDVLLLDLDDTLLFTKEHEKYSATPLLAHPKLPGLLNKLQSQGVVCIGLTARKQKHADATEKQLAEFGMSFKLAERLLADSTFPNQASHYQKGVFYSSSTRQEDKKISTKGETALSVLHALKNIKEHRLKENYLNRETLAKRVVALDDLSMNVVPIQQSLLEHKDQFSIKSIATCSVDKKAIFISNKKNQTRFPENVSTLTLIKHLGGGSGGVYVLEDAHSKQYTFKAHEDLDHLQEELVSDALYQAAGCAVPDFAIITEMPACLESLNLPRNGIYRLAEFIPANSNQDPALIKAELAKHFLVDVLLANWDIAVADFKNVLFGQDNCLYRIDNGGALRYRAKKGLKVKWSACFVDELDTLRDPNINKDAAAIYGHLTQDELIQQHRDLLKHANTLLITLNQLDKVLNITKIGELHHFLNKRLYDLEMRLQTTAHPYAQAFESLAADKKHTSASILATCTINNIPSGLFGKRIRHEWYGDFGGKSEPTDVDLFTTASREAFEETAGLLNVSLNRLGGCPSHDLITETDDKQFKTHRMFITEHNYISSKQLLNEVKNDVSHTQEYTAFTWVPIQALRAALDQHSTTIEEGIETLKVSYICPETGQEQSIALYPPMVKMLQQAPIKEALEKREQNKALSNKRTRSHAKANYSQFQTAPLIKDTLPLGTYENTAMHLKVRRFDQAMEKEEKIEEIIYPDPEAEQRALINKTVLMAQLNQTIKGGLKQRAVQENKTQELQNPTQTLAHLQVLIGQEKLPIENLVACFFKEKMESTAMAKDAAFHDKLVEVIQAESEYPNRIVLYHATNSKMGFFCDFISKLRSLLVMENIRSLRAFDDVFKDIEDVEQFIIEQCQKQAVTRYTLNNYQADYRDKGLSCNFSLFGNFNRASSSTIQYFYKDESSTNNEVSVLINGINMVLNRLNIKRVNPQELFDLYDKHKQDLGAHLYQIFIEENQVDKFCYLSGQSGCFFQLPQAWLTDPKGEDEHHLLRVIKASRENPKAFQKLLVSQELKGAQLHARLYMHPRLMHNSDVVAIKTYKNQKNQQLLQNELFSLVQRIAQELLLNKQSLQENYRGSTQGQSELTPLQTLYAFVSQGETNQSIRYDQNFNFEILYEHIQSNNAEAFEQTLRCLPNGIDLSKDVVDFSGNKKQPLLYSLIQDNQINLLNILLNSKHCTPAMLKQPNDEGITSLTLMKSKHKDIVLNPAFLLLMIRCSLEDQRQLFSACFNAKYYNAWDCIYVHHRHLLVDIEKNKLELTKEQQIQLEALKKKDAMHKALLYAVEIGNVTGIEEMLQDDQGSTALMLAVQQYQDMDVVKFLLANNADIYRVNNKHASVLTWCFDPDFPEDEKRLALRGFLLSYMIKLPPLEQSRILKSQNLTHTHILDFVCSTGVPCLKSVLECYDLYSENPDAKGFVMQYFKTEWIQAIQNGNYEVVNEILSLYPESIYSKDFKYQTALQYWLSRREHFWEEDDFDSETGIYVGKTRNYPYETEEVDNFIKFLLSKYSNLNPTEFERIRDLHNTKKYGLFFYTLKTVACFDLEKQKQIVGPRYPDIFAWTNNYSPELLKDLVAVPNAQGKEVWQKNIQLLDAAHKGDLDGARRLILEGADVNFCHEKAKAKAKAKAKTPLLIAIDNGNQAMMNLLFKQGAKFKINADLLDSIIGHPSAAPFLPEIFVEIASYPLDSQELILSDWYGKYDNKLANMIEFVADRYPMMLHFLLRNPRVLPQKDNEIRTKLVCNNPLLLILACQPGSSQLMDALLDDNQAVSTYYTDDATKDSLLMQAMHNRADDVVACILAHEVDLLARNCKGKNVFDVARKHCPQYLPVLLSKALLLPEEMQKDFLKQKKEKYDRVLTYVIKHAQLLSGIADHLLLSHIPLNKPLQLLGGDSALLNAAKTGNQEYLKTLLRLGASCYVVDKARNTALMEAVKARNFEVAQVLLEARVPLQIRNTENKNVFDLALSEPQFMPYLLQHAHRAQFSELDQSEMLKHLPEGNYKTFKEYQSSKYPQIELDRPACSEVPSLSRHTNAFFQEQKPLKSDDYTRNLLVQNELFPLIQCTTSEQSELTPPQTSYLGFRPDEDNQSIRNEKGIAGMQQDVENNAPVQQYHDTDKARWIQAIQNKNFEVAQEILSLYPECIYSKDFNQQTALQYWLSLREEDKSYSVTDMDDDDFPTYHYAVFPNETKEVDDFIKWLLSKQPNLNPIEFQRIVRLHNMEEYGLFSYLLEKIACFSLEEQKQVVGQEYPDIFAWTNKHAPHYLKHLVALPNAQGKEVWQRNIQLLDAAHKGDLDVARRLILEGADVNFCFEEKKVKHNPLLIAIGNGNQLMMNLFFNHGAKFEITSGLLRYISNYPESEPLLPEIFVEMASYPLDSQQIILSPCYDKYNNKLTNILEFVADRYPMMLHLLLRNPRVLPQKDNEMRKKLVCNNALLIRACQPGSRQLMDALLDDNQAVSTCTDDATKNSLLMQAMHNHAFDVVDCILAHEVDLLARNGKGKNVFDVARKYCPQYLPTLLSKALLLPEEMQKEFLKQKKEKHDRVLTYVIKHALLSTIVDYLSQSHIPTSKQLQLLGGDSALLNAAKTGNQEYLQILLRLGASCHVVDKARNTALMEAVKARNFEVAQGLLEACVPLQIRNTQNMNVFDLAQCEPQFMPYLLQYAHRAQFSEAAQLEMLQYLPDGNYKTFKAYQAAKYPQIELDKSVRFEAPSQSGHTQAFFV